MTSNGYKSFLLSFKSSRVNWAVCDTKTSNTVAIVEIDYKVDFAPLDIVTLEQKVMAEKEEK